MCYNCTIVNYEIIKPEYFHSLGFVTLCSPLQFICVFWQETLPQQTEAQDRHQVSVQSRIILIKGTDAANASSTVLFFRTFSFYMIAYLTDNIYIVLKLL